MSNPIWLEEHTQRTLDRVIPRLESRINSFTAKNPDEWALFTARLEKHFGRLFAILLHLYQDQYDFFYHLEELLVAITKLWIKRSTELKALDQDRELHRDWFQTHTMLGGVCYVDLFAGDLNGIRDKIPYFEELGLT